MYAYKYFNYNFHFNNEFLLLLLFLYFLLEFIYCSVHINWICSTMCSIQFHSYWVEMTSLYIHIYFRFHYMNYGSIMHHPLSLSRQCNILFSINNNSKNATTTTKNKNFTHIWVWVLINDILITFFEFPCIPFECIDGWRNRTLIANKMSRKNERKKETNMHTCKTYTFQYLLHVEVISKRTIAHCMYLYIYIYESVYILVWCSRVFNLKTKIIINKEDI